MLCQEVSPVVFLQSGFSQTDFEWDPGRALPLGQTTVMVPVVPYERAGRGSVRSYRP